MIENHRAVFFKPCFFSDLPERNIAAIEREPSQCRCDQQKGDIAFLRVRLLFQGDERNGACQQGHGDGRIEVIIVPRRF